MSSAVERDPVEVRATNVGGISETAVEIPPGVTVLTGRNATNRTSFLQAVMAALGSDDVSLKGDADEGSVALEVGGGGETYARTLRRRGQSVVTEGEPYLDDPTVADLFAFLLESNEARRAVARNDDLRELIMRPVDIDEIEDRIAALKAEQRRIDERLDDLARLEDQQAALESDRTDLAEQLADERAALEAVRAELESADVDVEERREGKTELDEKFAALQEARSELEDVRFGLETERESIASLEDDLAEYDDRLDELGAADDDELAEIEREVERLREEKQALDAEVNELQRLIEFNQEMLERDGAHPLNGSADDETITDRLLSESETVVCWTCGSEVDAAQIESTVDRLRELSQQKFQERAEIQAELDEQKRAKRQREEARRTRRELERRRQRTASEIDDRDERLEALEDEREELEATIERLETEVDELRGEELDDVVELHKEANRLEIEVGRLERELDEVETDLEDVERRLSEREDLEREREDVRSELTDLRTRVDRIERRAVDAFNTKMDEVLDRLDYANLERIWLERVEREGRDGRRTVEKTEFELHVVRTTAEGATYEDTIAHLSESEREVTGLVFALAGYLVHDVHETVPFMLLDSLEAIDAERIAALVDYLADYADFLVVALLPEDAAALDDAYHRVTDI